MAHVTYYIREYIVLQLYTIAIYSKWSETVCLLTLQGTNVPVKTE